MNYKQIVVIFVMTSISFNLHAKRRAPDPVEPVIYKGVEYRAPTEKMGYVQAWKDNRLLWEKRVYKIWYNPLVEKDVQDVFITNLQVADSTLTVRNEKGKIFTIKINDNGMIEPQEESGNAFKIVQGNTTFAVDLYGQLSKTEGNLFFSPYSLSTALAMVYGGAKSATADEMARTMHYDANDIDFHDNYGQLIRQLNEQGEKQNYQLLIANALWGQKDFRFLDPYLSLTKHNYGANLEPVDYVTAPQKAAETINKWVEDKTQEKIKNLISPDSLDAMTRLVLTNAIYFKGDWAEQFDKTDTKQAAFYLTPKDTVQAPLMHRQGRYKYAEHVSFGDAGEVRMQILELPYKADELSMVAILPQEHSLRLLEEGLSAETLKTWTKVLKSKEVDVYLPKFKMTSRFELSKVLGQMGMPQAFSQSADFSGMTGGRDLFIAQVVHKAYVDVNEEGTEAAAATGVEMKLTAMPMEPPVFRADRPFIFLIKDNATGSILFMGRVANPTEKE